MLKITTYVLDFEKEGIAAGNKANRDYEIISEGILTKFNTLKMRELQLQHLVSAGIISKHKLPNIRKMLRGLSQKEWNFSKESIDLFESYCDNCIKTLTAVIPPNFLDDLELCDTHRYTQLNYGILFSGTKFAVWVDNYCSDGEKENWLYKFFRKRARRK